MSKRDPRLFVEDMIASIERIEGFISGHDLESFKTDRMTRDATILNLAIIGEAANRLPDEVKKLMPGVIWKDVIGLRNIIVHKYFALDPKAIWEIVTQELPALKLKAQTAMEQLDQTPQNHSSS